MFAVVFGNNSLRLSKIYIKTIGFLKSQVRSGWEEGGDESKAVHVTQCKPKEKRNAPLLTSFLEQPNTQCQPRKKNKGMKTKRHPCLLQEKREKVKILLNNFKNILSA